MVKISSTLRLMVRCAAAAQKDIQNHTHKVAADGTRDECARAVIEKIAGGNKL